MDLFFSTCFRSLYISLILFIFSREISGATFTLVNKCGYTVWPGVLGNTRLDSTGFELLPGGSRSFQVPPTWSGRFWARTGCTFDPSTGQGSCTSADCGSNQIECNGSGANPPATLAEFTTGSGTPDFYDVSLVDGYNLPMIVEPTGGSGNCLSTGCITDLNQRCPTELRVESGEGCKSACEAFRTPEYCCSGAFGTPDVCKPSVYSEIFKTACPRSYSYAYDDATSTFTCTGADYTITFCPSTTSQKSASATNGSATGSPTITTTSATNGSANGSSSVTGSSTEPMEDNGSWLPNFISGDSSSRRTFPSSAFHSTLIASMFSFIFLYFLYL
ncbi:hypothetical protein Ddye_007277 [Dipteronia dyeriana]|uniref:Thaumatin-like protein n=1 Tax=Dipteronia dyeriana TaxID=168575 RepID=A0AAE0CRJ2_9ROSI|nr:hypothetical protein Ddye_007277 [Dipteronia dyeriana]